MTTGHKPSDLQQPESITLELPGSAVQHGPLRVKPRCWPRCVPQGLPGREHTLLAFSSLSEFRGYGSPSSFSSDSTVSSTVSLAPAQRARTCPVAGPALGQVPLQDTGGGQGGRRERANRYRGEKTMSAAGGHLETGAESSPRLLPRQGTLTIHSVVCECPPGRGTCPVRVPEWTRGSVLTGVPEDGSTCAPRHGVGDFGRRPVLRRGCSLPCTFDGWALPFRDLAGLH